jgi:hypothetical protein
LYDKSCQEQKEQEERFSAFFFSFEIQIPNLCARCQVPKGERKKNQWPTALPKVSHKGENALPIICFCGCFSPHVRTASIYAAAAPV